MKTSFWSSKKVRSLSDDAKLLFTYLVACPHGNSIGCFVLPLGYVVEDMGWTSQKVSERIRELVSNGFIERDEDTRVIRIISWWEHNGIENGNMARSVVNLAENLPSCAVSYRAVLDLLSLENRFLNEFRTRLESVSPVFVNNEPETETDTIISRKRNRTAFAVPEEEFILWWSEVPNKVKKEYARECYTRCREKGVSPETLLLGAKKWHSQAARESGSFTPLSNLHPSTWLNDQRWQDETTKSQQQVSGAPMF